jgi:hypothetical protein
MRKLKKYTSSVFEGQQTGYNDNVEKWKKALENIHELSIFMREVSSWQT